MRTWNGGSRGSLCCPLALSVGCFCESLVIQKSEQAAEDGWAGQVPVLYCAVVSRLQRVGYTRYSGLGSIGVVKMQVLCCKTKGTFAAKALLIRKSGVDVEDGDGTNGGVC